MTKVMIVEDDDLIRKSTVKILGFKGIEAKGFIDCECAENEIDQYHPDLVVTDNNLGLGKEKGIDFARRLKAKGMPVCLCSSDIEAMEQAAEDGIPCFLKPIEADDIQALINH